jgi:hypothetical protein
LLDGTRREGDGEQHGEEKAATHSA